MVAAALIFLSTALGGCERAVLAFSEYAIARTLEALPPKDRHPFSAIIRGFKYEDIKRKFQLSEDEFESIKSRGLEILWAMKKSGL